MAMVVRDSKSTGSMTRPLMAVVASKHEDSAALPLMHTLLVVLLMVCFLKKDATMVLVVKCELKDSLALPLSHALMVVLSLMWLLEIYATLAVHGMAKIKIVVTAVGSLPTMGVVPPPSTAVVKCKHEDWLAHIESQSNIVCPGTRGPQTSSYPSEGRNICERRWTRWPHRVGARHRGVPSKAARCARGRTPRLLLPSRQAAPVSSASPPVTRNKPSI